MYINKINAIDVIFSSETPPADILSATAPTTTAFAASPSVTSVDTV